jgi:hypothetical protein
MLLAAFAGHHRCLHEILPIHRLALPHVHLQLDYLIAV